MFRRILVPLDGSRFAEQALEPALHLAQQAQGIVDLLRVPVYGDSGIPDVSEYDLQWAETNSYVAHDQAADYLRDVKRSRALSGVSLRTAVVEGDRCSAIVDMAAANHSDLIVMASHARTGLARLILGSVANGVLRQTPCPLLIVRDAAPPAHMLVALDGSPLAEQGLGPALDLARAFGCRVTLLRVCEASDPDRQDTQGYLQAMLEEHAGAGLEAGTATVSGAVGPAILRFAKESGVDLIAMTTHGRSGVKRLFYGSVTEFVAAGAGCAMLITRSA